jgi:hypothetical protein
MSRARRLRKLAREALKRYRLGWVRANDRLMPAGAAIVSLTREESLGTAN